MSAALTDYVTWKDGTPEARWRGRKIPMSTFNELYFDGKLDITGDLNDLLDHRELFIKWSLFTPEHLRFFITRFIPEVAIHSKKQDERIVRWHYDRGNDFFNWFLGDTMVYTSGYVRKEGEDLDTVQRNKLAVVCEKLQLKPGEELLDIGCGWGTLALHAAKHHDVKATGVTIARNQVDFGNERIARAGLGDRARILCLDYRDIPERRYRKIACLEMAEHVGVKNFQKFCRQVYRLLEDDGLFYLQIAGLRAGFHREDLIWGLFMGKYIFSGADASMPLSFVVRHLEKAGFEIHSVENIGTHYVYTISLWYQNWVKNKDEIIAKYGERWFRIWHIFLGWSQRIGNQGCSTCFQIVCNKNLDAFDRRRWRGRMSLDETARRLDVAA